MPAPVIARLTPPWQARYDMADTIVSFGAGAARRATDTAAPADWPAWPGYGLVEDLLPVIREWHDAGRRIALATLVEVTGSSPRPVGSEMAINDQGQVAGYVSGGCVEAAVAAQALVVMQTGEPALLDYGAGSPVLDVQLTCGGRIGIFVRALADCPAFIQRWSTARAQRTAFDLDIDLRDGSHRYACAIDSREGRIFHQRYLPQPRLVVVGGDPVTLALCQMAPMFDYQVVLLRPYGPSAPPPGTTLAHYDTRPLARALGALALDAFTAVYTLTHDMDDDHAVLEKTLASDAFSAGALGSRTKSAEREHRLRAAGFDERALARLHTPAGVSINAREPREIALAVLAETIALRPRARSATG